MVLNLGQNQIENSILEAAIVEFNQIKVEKSIKLILEGNIS